MLEIIIQLKISSSTGVFIVSGCKKTNCQSIWPVPWHLEKQMCRQRQLRWNSYVIVWKRKICFKDSKTGISTQTCMFQNTFLKDMHSIHAYKFSNLTVPSLNLFFPPCLSMALLFAGGWAHMITAILFISNFMRHQS